MSDTKLKWEYRLCKVPVPGKEESKYEIRAVFYKDGEIETITSMAIPAWGNSLKLLANNLILMQEAFTRDLISGNILDLGEYELEEK